MELDIERDLDSSNCCLIGKYFHILEEDMDFQGRILSMINEDLLLVEFYDWATGKVTHQKLVYIHNISNWIFYPSCEIMMDAYKQHMMK